MSHHVPRHTVKSILRRMIRRPWHTSGREVLDWNGHVVAKVVDEESSEAKLIRLAPEIALAYVDSREECEQLRAEIEVLEDRLETAERDQRESA